MLRGVYFPWIGEISYEMTLDPGEARGTSPYPMGVTMGELKANASVTIQRVYRERFINIFEQGVPGFMTKFAPIQVVTQEQGLPTVEIDSFDARITGTSHDFSAGNNALMTKFPLYVPFVKINGHVPVPGIQV